MKVCSKCKIEKDDKQYYTYYHSTQKRFRTRNICQECVSFQKKQYKSKIREEKLKMKEVSIQPEKVATITPELQPDTFKDNPLYKFCKSCNQYKLLTDFYYNRGIQGYATSCKVCHNEYAHQKQREFYENKYKNNGGSEIIPNKPNTYRDIYQKEQAFWIMELMGWTYNENGIWSKIGIKDLNNNWTNVKVIEKKKRGIGPRKKREYDVDKIKELRDSGFYLSEIAKIMKCSKPTIVKLLKTTYL